MNKQRTFTFLLIATAAGYGWLLWASLAGTGHDVVCPMKLATGLPCPSCGATRSVMALAHGDVAAAWAWNPLGFVLASLLLVLPVWLVADAFTGRRSSVKAYVTVEQTLRKRWVAVPAVVLLLCNWIWNIHKGL